MAETPGAGSHRRWSAVVVDDSAIIRGLVAKALESDPRIQVVGSVSDGSMAVEAARRNQPDILVLDIEMPVMNGLDAIKPILEASPRTRILMSSTLTTAGAEATIRALSLGAADFVAKPSTMRSGQAYLQFKTELLEKAKAICGISGRPPEGMIESRSLVSPPGPRPETPVTLRPLPTGIFGKFSVVCIGSSTGGPQALFELVKAIAHPGMPPILITQHMPTTFIPILAEHIASKAGVVCSVARDGDPIFPGRVYVAPGDHHMLVEMMDGVPAIRVSDAPPENFCRPAVDPMLRSAAQVFGGRVLACILTGMGHDGLAGCRIVANEGGIIVAQDEATSVVWGMPGAVAKAGVANAVLPLKDLGPYIVNVTLGRHA
jgi:two-component system chemotaxis response regulator CheB